MNNKDIKKQLRQESKLFVPNKKEHVMASLHLIPSTPKKQSYRMAFKPAILFSMVLVFLLVFSFSMLTKNPPMGVSAHTIITIDINPSIELDIDENDQVIASRPLNVDAAMLLEEVNLIQLPVTEAIDTILSLLVENGYLKEDIENQVSINAVNENSEKEEKLNQQISVYYQNKKEVRVTEVAEHTKKAAQSHKVSAHKMALIEAVMQQNQTMTLDEAKALSIQALNEILRDYSPLKISGFMGDYKNKVEDLSHAKDNALSVYNLQLNQLHVQINNIKNLVKKERPLNLISQQTRIMMDEFFPSYDFIEPEMKYQAYSDFLNELSNDLSDQETLIKKMIHDKYKNQMDSFKENMRDQLTSGKDFNFEFEFDKDFSMDQFKGRSQMSAGEQEAVQLISRIETMMHVGQKNNQSRVHIDQKIEELASELDLLLASSQITDDFKNSELVIKFYQKYDAYKD